jgi:hypothetical protein
MAAWASNVALWACIGLTFQCESDDGAPDATSDGTGGSAGSVAGQAGEAGTLVLQFWPLICTEPPDVGPCESPTQRYYFDPETAECREFMYGGCDGNENNWATRTGCTRYCINHLSCRCMGDSAASGCTTTPDCEDCPEDRSEATTGMPCPMLGLQCDGLDDQVCDCQPADGGTAQWVCGVIVGS